MAKLLIGINDFATLYPDLASEWDCELNDSLQPNEVTANSNKQVWWKCKMGHSWQAPVARRTSQNSGCPYCSGRLPIVGKTDLLTLNPGVAAEWDYERNNPLTPKDVTIKSGKRIWWKCKKGHSWQAPVARRTSQNSGCPYCCGRLPIVGQTDLATVNPNLAKEWDDARNYPLTPKDVTYASNKTVWWKCQKGHSWKATIHSRHDGNGCPYCAGQLPVVGQTDLATVNPNLAKEWDDARNYPLTPKDVTYASNKTVWWKCQKGHSWKATIHSRHDGNGCPYCAGQLPVVGQTDLATVNPNLAKEWDDEQNYPLTPSDVTIGSGKKVWWKCSKGHVWRASIVTRLQNASGCPYCSGRKRTGKDLKYYYI